MSAQMNINGLIPTSIFVLLTMAACASKPTYDEYSGTPQPESSYDGRVYVYRLTTVGSDIRPTVRLDGEPVGRAIAEGFFYLDLPAGDYEISAAKNTKRILSFRLKVGEIKYVRLEMKIGNASWNATPVLVDAEVAKEELKKTEYSGNSGDSSLN